MPKVVSLKLRELRKRGYNNVSEWLVDASHLYIGRQMNISIYTKVSTMEPPRTKVSTNRNGKKILIRPYKMHNIPFDKHLLIYPIGSYVDNNGKIVRLCCIPQSKWHNPFKVTQYDTRGQVIDQFKKYLLSNELLMKSLNELKNYTEIGCWCKPKSCHGDTILNEYHKYKIRQRNAKNLPHNKQNIQQKTVTNIASKTQNQNEEEKYETKMNDNNDHDCVDVWNMLPLSNKHNTTFKPKISNISLTMGMRTNISVESALVIIPPKNKWREIQNIRKLYDPAFNRWPPHINILFPFIERKYFNQISKYILNVIIKPNNIKSFNIYLNSFDVFDRIKTQTKTNQNSLKKNTVWNQNKMETLFLKPHGCYQELQKIFNLLRKDWIKCASKHDNKFIAHLTVGKFKIKEINKYKNSFQSSWKPISFKCDSIYLISRTGKQPFKITHKIPLC